MQQYIFILGREPELSLAEIKAVAVTHQVKLSWLKYIEPYVLVESDGKLDFFNELAGVVKIAEVIATIKLDKNLIQQTLLDFIKNQTEGRAIYGLSWYGGKAPNFLKQLGLSLKHDLKESISRVRYVVSKDKVLSSVTVKMNKLLPPDGFEFLLLQENNELLVARTVWVQNFADWSSRDFGRPARDAKVGMLPPKLARLMINLAGGHKNQPILDPFCGSGTVLQEAALLGYKNIWGSDIDAKGITRTKDNLDWLRKNNTDLIWQQQVAQADVRRLQDFVKQNQFMAIVTEPYLGPPLTGREEYKKLQEVEQGLAEFYRQALKAMAAVMLPKARLVMVIPVLNFNRKPIYINLPNMSELGFSVIETLPEIYVKKAISGRAELLYARTDQKVGREIWVWQKK